MLITDFPGSYWQPYFLPVPSNEFQSWRMRNSAEPLRTWRLLRPEQRVSYEWSWLMLGGKLEFASKPPAKCGGFIPPIKNIGSCTISMGWTSLGCTSQNLVAMTSISSPQLTAAKSLISIRWIGKRRKKRPAEGLFSKITLKGPATKDRGKNLEKSAGLPNWKQSGLSASGLASGWKGSIFFGVLSLPSSKVVQVWSVLALSEKTRETQERESLWVSSIYGNDIMPKWGLLRGNASLHWTPLHSGLSFYRTLPR